jgi:hypothetical protein
MAARTGVQSDGERPRAGSCGRCPAGPGRGANTFARRTAWSARHHAHRTGQSAHAQSDHRNADHPLRFGRARIATNRSQIVRYRLSSSAAAGDGERDHRLTRRQPPAPVGPAAGRSRDPRYLAYPYLNAAWQCPVMADGQVTGSPGRCARVPSWHGARLRVERGRGTVRREFQRSQCSQCDSACHLCS